MAAVWTEDPTIGNALAGVANAAYGGPMLQLKATEAMQGIQQRRLEMQRLQQQLQYQKQFSDLSTSLLGGDGSGLPAIGQGSGQPPSGDQDVTGQPSTSSPSFSQAAPGQSADALHAQLKPYYAAGINLAVGSGDMARAQELRDEAIHVLSEDYGARTPREALQLHKVYSNLKGPDAQAFASRLENYVHQGGQLTRPYANFMWRYGDAAAPLTRDSSGAFVRGTLPYTAAVQAELARNGFDMQGFPGVSTGGGTGQAPAAGATTAAAPPAGPGAAQGPQWTTLDAPLTPVQQFAKDAKYAETVGNDPDFQNARAQQTTADRVLQSLSEGNRLSSLAALGAVIHTILPNARVAPGQTKEQLDDLMSKREALQEEYEHAFKSNIDLPNWLKIDIGNLAVHQADIAKGIYDTKYAPIIKAYKETGGNPDIAFPNIPRVNPIWRATGTVPEGQQPAPGPAAAPGQATAPGFQGRTATNPKTGQRMREVAPNDWEPY